MRSLSEIHTRRHTLGTGVELEVAERGLADGTPLLMLHGATDSWRSYRLRIQRAAFTELLSEDLGNLFKRITAPTLLIHGGRDAYVPIADLETLRRRIRGARVELRSGSGHAMHWEEPAHVAQSIDSFVRSLHTHPLVESFA